MRILMLLILALAARCAAAELTLEQARALAVADHPRLKAAEFTAEAASRRVAEYRAAYYPALSAIGTAAGASDGNARIAAGALNNPTVFDRMSVGIQAVQLLYDFGRTGALVAGAQAHARAAHEQAAATRDELLYDVDSAYIALLQARALKLVAHASVAARQLVADRVAALAASHLKSDLDAGFATLQLEQGKLLESSAEEAIADGAIRLGGLVGRAIAPDAALAQLPEAPATAAPFATLWAAALRGNPEIARLAAERDEQLRLARAAIAQDYPRLSAVGASGYSPVHDSRLADRYSAGAINLTVPLFDGFAYIAERDAALLQAKALDRDLADYQINLADDLRVVINQVAYLGQELGMERKVSEQAHLAYRLAEARYQIGSSSMIELSQAQLAVTQADIDLARCRFAQRLAQAHLDYDTGSYPPAAMAP